MTPEPDESVTIKIPKGKPYLVIVFQGEGSALADVHREKVLPAQILSIVEYLRIEAAYAFNEHFKTQQRIIVPAGSGH